MAIARRWGGIRISLLVLLFLGLVGGAAFFLSRQWDQANGADPEPQDSGEASQVVISVKTVRPRLDKDFQMTVERPAEVEAYYWANIEARVPGVVKEIRVAPGSRVQKDQRLVKIDVPDLDATKIEKFGIIGQRQKEVKLAQAKIEAAQAAVDTARANIEEKKALLRQEKAGKLFRSQQFERLSRLHDLRSIDQDVVEEAARNLEYAAAREDAARAAIIKAQSELEDAKANYRVAKADEEQKKQLIEVARADYEQAKALDDYATVRAPFRGQVVRRLVDPGSFVQNASTGNPTPLLALERTDIVTVVMRVPDNYAPFVSEGTEAILELDALPGLKIHGKVTRFAPSLVTASHDRTMRVEVDLWNRTPAGYERFIHDPNNLADLKEGPLPLVPQVSGKNAGDRSTHLLPGMYGKMRLVLRSFGDTYLVPSQTIVCQGGETFLYVVQEGKAHLMQVAVQMDDGVLAKVERLGPHEEVLGDLTGSEEVVASNQEELSEGQPLRTTPLESWKALAITKDAH